MREITEQILLEQFAPVAAVVNRHGDIYYLHGRSGRYLEPSPGEAGVSNILKMAREGLRHDLTTCLYQALGGCETIRANGLRVKTNDHFTLVNITICPMLNSSMMTAEMPLYLVTLQDAPDAPDAPDLLSDTRTDNGDLVTDTDPLITALKRELRAKDEYLLATHEELQSSNEELKSSNEEMQSVNEELQSTNEELETSKEELQSINEELSTVNTELQTKVTDLSRANNDMNNLLAGTGVATVFVDHSLRILRFTPTATRIINLIAGDVGRPVGHIVSNLQAYDSLVTDVQWVLDTLVPKETEVQTLDGKWYVLRILPYRTLDNVIEGVVVTFIDITEVKHTQDELQKAERLLRLAVLPRDALDAMTVHDLQGRILAWNPGAVRLYGWTEAEALQMNVRQCIPKDMADGALDAVHHISLAKSLDSQRTSRLTKDGTVLAVSVTATPLCNELGQIYGVATLERPM
jgi:two-component system CheB/CheR fusion protein